MLRYPKGDPPRKERVVLKLQVKSALSKEIEEKGVGVEV